MPELTITLRDHRGTQAPRGRVLARGRCRAGRPRHRGRRRHRPRVGPAALRSQRAAGVRGRHRRARDEPRRGVDRRGRLRQRRQDRRGAGRPRDGQILSIPVGDELLGRVVNALGEPVDGKGPVATTQSRRMEVQAPGIMGRQPGQRAAPDRHQGHRLDDADRPWPARAHHRRPQDRQDHRRDRHDPEPKGPGREVHLRRGRPEELVVAQTVRILEEFGAFEYTVVVLASAQATPRRSSSSRPTRAARWDSTGWRTARRAHRLRRPLEAGRGLPADLAAAAAPAGPRGVPGDVFYLHSRLLERAAKLSAENGGGSLTALPIIETKAGDISAYIPTNVISITDGQVFLQSDLFYSGVRPAISVGNSVSRVGNAATIKAMRAVNGSLKIDLAQFRDLEASRPSAPSSTRRPRPSSTGAIGSPSCSSSPSTRRCPSTSRSSSSTQRPRAGSTRCPWRRCGASSPSCWRSSAPASRAVAHVRDTGTLPEADALDKALTTFLAGFDTTA